MDHAPGWIIATQYASRGVLLVLIALSVWSVAIMVDRWRAFKGLTQSSPSATPASGIGQAIEEARKLILARDWGQLERWSREAIARSAPDVGIRLPAGTIHAALETDRSPESVDRAVRSYLTRERVELERGLTALATLGSNAPFIGLFGTVLGIIQAFGALATTSTSSGTTSIMTGISEALVATAVGLFVAIPAVIAYNVFSRKLRLVLSECDSLRDYYLSRLGQRG
jgi:biopolymer transport protein ExbB/TolQ